MFHCIKSLAVSFVLGGILISAPASAAEAPVTLPFMGSYVEEHPAVANVWKPFFEATEKKFANKISFSYFAENALYSNQADDVQGISDGRTAFGCVRPSVHPDEFRLCTVIGLPGLVPNAVVGALVLEDIITKFAEVRAELPKASEHFVAWTSAASQINMATPVKSLADIKGKKIAVWDTAGYFMVRELGAYPVRVSPDDTYWTLQRGLADGVLCPIAPLKAYRLADLVKHHLLIDATVQGFIIQASHKYWKPMPKAMKQWIKAEGGSKMALALGQTLEEGVKNGIADMKVAGHVFTALPESDKPELASVRYIMTSRWKEYCRDMDVDLVGAVLTYARERAKFHTEAQKAGKYGN